jgi:putative ABC transport system substrate-binding protein
MPLSRRAVLNYVEGQNLAMDWRFAQGDVAALPTLAAEIVKSQPEVVVTAGTLSALAMHKATQTLPVVFGNVSDPLGAGLVRSLNQGGTNMTGIASLSSPMMPKLLELLAETYPAATRMAVLFNPLQPSHAGILRSLEPVAAARRLQLKGYPAATPRDIAEAFDAMTRDGVQAVMLPVEGLFIQQRAQIGELGASHRLALAGIDAELADAGALLTYGPDQHAMFRRMAVYVDRILRGAKPQDLPVEQPSTFVLAVNRKAERALQLRIPATVLMRAERVIP